MPRNLRLYTFLLEYKKGTYISQLRAPSPQKALEEWAESLDVKDIKSLGKNTKEELIRKASSEALSSVEGLSNVWCVSFLLENTLALLHFIQTETD